MNILLRYATSNSFCLTYLLELMHQRYQYYNILTVLVLYESAEVLTRYLYLYGTDRREHYETVLIEIEIVIDIETETSETTETTETTETRTKNETENNTKITNAQTEGIRGDGPFGVVAHLQES